MIEQIFCGFPLLVAIVPPADLIFSDVKLYLCSQVGKRYELAATDIDGTWLASLSAEQTAEMMSGKYSVQLDYAEVGIDARQPSDITTITLRDRV